MPYPAHAAPPPGSAAPLPSPAPPKCKHMRKTRVSAPPPVHATHEVAASASHADTSEAWLRIAALLLRSAHRSALAAFFAALLLRSELARS
eukprot:612846-Rhodomonas_salina.1